MATGPARPARVTVDPALQAQLVAYHVLCQLSQLQLNVNVPSGRRRGKQRRRRPVHESPYNSLQILTVAAAAANCHTDRPYSGWFKGPQGSRLYLPSLLRRHFGTACSVAHSVKVKLNLFSPHRQPCNSKQPRTYRQNNQIIAEAL